MNEKTRGQILWCNYRNNPVINTTIIAGRRIYQGCHHTVFVTANELCWLNHSQRMYVTYFIFNSKT